MASFPSAVKSFTTKNTADVIQAAHVNDLQDEVAAIEGGYINGTARLNSSNLSVTGTSTFTGLVTFNAGQTFATLDVSGGSTFGVRPLTPPPHIAVAFLESTVTLGSSVLSTISWLADSILTNSSMHSTGANPQRLTPQSTGVYRVSAQIEFAGLSVQRRVRVIDSSNTQIAEQTVPASATANDLTVQVMGYKRFDALGGFVTCVHVSTAGPSTQSLSTGVGGTWFALEKL